MFSESITLGDLLTILGFVFTLWMFDRRNTRRLVIIEHRVGLMWNVFKRRFNITKEDIENGDNE